MRSRRALGRAEEGPHAGPVAMVVRSLDRLAATVGPHAVFFHVDALTGREAPVHVEHAGAVPPRAHEAVLTVAVAHPGQLGVGAQHAEHKALDGVEVRGVEATLGDELRPEPRRPLGVAQEAVVWAATSPAACAVAASAMARAWARCSRQARPPMAAPVNMVRPTTRATRATEKRGRRPSRCTATRARVAMDFTGSTRAGSMPRTMHD